MEINRVYVGDALETLKKFESESINCCITSPPYYGLRDYGVDGQIGLEDSPEEYIERLSAVFDEVWRVLRPDGTLWVNIADSYFGSGKGSARYPENAKKYKQGSNRGTTGAKKTAIKWKSDEIKPKDLIGIPWIFALELRRRGWYLRQDIIWAKPNPMPESVTDRCTKSHEYLFLFSKQNHYYFDAEAISEPVAPRTIQRLGQDIKSQKGSYLPGKTNGNMKAAAPRFGGKKYSENKDGFYRTKSGNIYDFRDRRNKRDVWTVTTKPFKDAHFATFPEDLIEPCVLAGCPIGGVILDPFFGSGTVGVVCTRKQRNYVGIELNPKYVNMANKRNSSVQIDLLM